MRKTGLIATLADPGANAGRVIAAIDGGGVSLPPDRLKALRARAASGRLTRQDVADAAHAEMLRRLAGIE